MIVTLGDAFFVLRKGRFADTTSTLSDNSLGFLVARLMDSFLSGVSWSS